MDLKIYVVFTKKFAMSQSLRHGSDHLETRILIRLDRNRY